MKKIGMYSLILILLDQIIKYAVSNLISINERISIIGDFLKLTYIKNSGAAFSILEGGRIFLIIIAFIAVIVIYFLLIKNNKITKLDTLIYTLIISGIIGNMIDRIIWGYVIDYIEFNILNYKMPIFNLADSLIVIGAIILLIKTVLEEKNAIQNK